MMDPPSTDDLRRWGAQLTKRAWHVGEAESIALDRTKIRACPAWRLSWNHGERLEFVLYWPVYASPRQQPVNRKRFGLVVETFGSANAIRTHNLSVYDPPTVVVT